MNYLKENKTTIIICISLILLALIITYFIKNDIFLSTGDKVIKDNYLRNYKVNELTPINMNEEQIARKYLAEYTKLLYYDPVLAYDLIEMEYRDKKFENIDKFKEYFNNKFDSKFFNAQVEQLSIKNTAMFKEFHIIDSSDNTYIFREYSIMQYKVIFDSYTI